MLAGRSTRMAMLVDTTKCIGCRACQLACKEWHNLPVEKPRFEGTYESPQDLSHNTWIRVIMREVEVSGETHWIFRPEMCKHCYQATCEKVCPVPGCITKDPASGFAVVLDDRLCVGCLYCVFACPFGVPRYEPDTRRVSKCNRCYDRSARFMTYERAGIYKTHVPYCVAACPTGALQFGPYENMKKVMGSRINMLKRKQGKDDVNPYGHEYMQGLGVFYILESTKDEDYDLPTYPRVPASIRSWQGLWKHLTYIMGGVAILFWFLHYAIIGPVGVKVVEAPEDEDRELTEEEYDRMIRTKRKAGKVKRDLPKDYHMRKRKRRPGGKGKPPAKRSRLPGKKARQEDEDF
jgi:formate dehydrogenase beta subunit